MTMKYCLLLLAACTVKSLDAQHTPGSTRVSDSATVLSEITVTAFHARSRWKDVPAAIATISSKDMARYASPTLVPLLNVLPGVRMEERSPGSYRLSVRGSLLRSPFGVRNIKVYWNDLPLTDGGGNTYLNLVDIGQLTGAELLKGPVASVYGAGTGGALLLRSDQAFTNSKTHQYEAGISGGSYGLFRQLAGWQYSNKNFSSTLQQSHLQADGYRQHSAMRRDAIKWQGAWLVRKQVFRFLAFYTDLFYQTPGGITLAQMQQNPKLARQPAGAFPGAVQQKAAIYNKTFFTGIHHTATLSSVVDIKSFVTANVTKFKNPFITNYEKRAEENIGAGFHIRYHRQKEQHGVQWITGGELLYNHSAIHNFGNRQGVADTVQFRDNIYARGWFLFSQLEYQPTAALRITGGLSVNNQAYRYKRLSNPAAADYTRKNISAVLTPRLALSYRINKNITLYALAAKGFSPPSLAELRPSDGNFYGQLNAENGWNYEAGMKGVVLGEKLQFDIATYQFRLKDAIVRRNNSSGAEYFVNAGTITQKGMELLLKYQLLKQPGSVLSEILLWSSYSYQPYRFTEYRQGATDYSGKMLTGVPRHIWVSGIDVETKGGLYLNLSLNAVASLPLNDANDALAGAYRLLQAKLGYRLQAAKQSLDFFAGMDNGLNQLYSLGNDINAAGKRYYNPAPGRNFAAGLHLRFR